MEVYLARPKLRSENHKTGTRAQLELYLKDWMRLPLDEISKAMVVRRHQEMSGSPLAANHVLRNFRAIYNHARQTCDLAECPTMAIERFEDKPDGRIIYDLKDWRQKIDGLLNPIHLPKRWSREIGPVVKVDQLAREMIQNDETKEPFA